MPSARQLLFLLPTLIAMPALAYVEEVGHDAPAPVLVLELEDEMAKAAAPACDLAMLTGVFAVPLDQVRPDVAGDQTSECAAAL